jgi:hypothetical protein
MMYLRSEFHISSFSHSLVIVIKWKAKYRFYATAVLQFLLHTEVEFFRTVFYHTKFQDSTLSDGSVTSAL